LRRFREQGFSFVKTDNQWYPRFAYRDFESIGRASANLELALQLSASRYGMWILNSMSMTPECYSNLVLSNVTRVSLDYIPLWKAAAKLHTLWNVYNSLFFSQLTYPDYDMWMSYDPCAELYAIAAVFSGGPIYITDRDPERTNAELLRKIVLPSGEIVRVDEPGRPTRDILFRDPYNEPVALKISSSVKGVPVVAVLNVYKGSRDVRSVLRLEDLPIPLHGTYAYYAVLHGIGGILREGDELEITVSECRGEVVVLAPITNGVAVIGLAEFLLPPYPIEVTRFKDRLYVRSTVEGTLVIFRRDRFERLKVSAEETIEVTPS